MTDTLHQLEQLAAAGAWDGPSSRYRGAEIPCLPSGHVCGLKMPGHPLNGVTFGVPGTITPLVDAWLDEGQLPRHLRQNERK
jgi:hypothetical protein